MTEKDAVATAETISAPKTKRAMSNAIVPLMDTELDMSNALNIGADDGNEIVNGMVTRMNKLVALLEAERPIIPDSNADYDIGYNNGLVMAQAIALKHDTVPVVRCKGCKHWTMGYCNHFAYYSYEPITGEDDFCSYGERKDNDKKQNDN